MDRFAQVYLGSRFDFGTKKTLHFVDTKGNKGKEFMRPRKSCSYVAPTYKNKYK